MKRLWPLVLAACGGPSSYDDFRQQLAARWADWQVACGQIGTSERPTADPPNMVLFYIEGGLTEDVPAAIKAGRVHFDSGSGQSCLDAIGGAPCDSAALGQKIGLQCHRVIRPAVATNQTCIGDGECSGGLCQLDSTGCRGSCAAWRSSGVACMPGATDLSNGCDPTAQFCGPKELDADLSAGGDTFCQTLRSHGDSCASDDQCVFGQVCLGQCSDPPHASNGDVCTAPGTLCDLGVFCGSDGRCAKQKGAGEPCASPNDCKKGLGCLGLGVDAMGMTTQGRCGNWLDAGAACAHTSGTRVDGCPDSMPCVNGQCTPPRARPAGPGQSCAGVGCAPGLWCDGMKCQFQVQQNGDCAPSANACLSGLKCNAQLVCSRQGC